MTVNLAVADIQLLLKSPFNTRTDLGNSDSMEDSMDTLTNSVKSNGVLDALTVEVGNVEGVDVYFVLDGFRRLAAIQNLIDMGEYPSETIPLNVREFENDAERETYVIATFARKQMNLHEKGLCYAKLLEAAKATNKKYNQSDLATALNISPAAVTQALTVGRASDKVVELFDNNFLSYSSYLEFATAENPETKKKFTDNEIHKIVTKLGCSTLTKWLSVLRAEKQEKSTDSEDFTQEKYETSNSGIKASKPSANEIFVEGVQTKVGNLILAIDGNKLLEQERKDKYTNVLEIVQAYLTGATDLMPTMAALFPELSLPSTEEADLEEEVIAEDEESDEYFDDEDFDDEDFDDEDMDEESDED